MTSHPIDQEILKVRRTPSVRAIVIPPCPESLRRLQDILAQSELDAGALDQLASSDVAMAAALIRQANSPLHGLAQPVQTVGMALTVLGLRPAAELLSAFITRHALQVHSPLLEHFWESSQRRAIACEHMGHQLYSFDPGLGYSFGLFCHVGIPALVKAVRGYATGNQGRGGGYYNWLPDSRHVVFSKDERGDENTQLRVFDAQAPGLDIWQVTPARGVRAWVVARGASGSARFVFASNERDRSTFDLYEADAATRQVSEVARSDGTVLAWLVGSDLRLAGRIRQLGRQDGSDAVLELRDAAGGWRVLKTWGGFDHFNVLRIDPAQGRLWALSNLHKFF